MEEVILALLVMIRAVESTDGRDPRANGNNYQITRRCLDDVNRIYKTRYRWPEDVRDDAAAKDIALLYLTYYGNRYLREMGKLPTADVLARIYNRGYVGAVVRGEGRGYSRKIETATKRNRFKAAKKAKNTNGEGRVKK